MKDYKQELDHYEYNKKFKLPKEHKWDSLKDEEEVNKRPNTTATTSDQLTNAQPDVANVHTVDATDAQEANQREAKGNGGVLVIHGQSLTCPLRSQLFKRLANGRNTGLREVLGTIHEQYICLIIHNV